MRKQNGIGKTLLIFLKPEEKVFNGEGYHDHVNCKLLLLIVMHMYISIN